MGNTVHITKRNLEGPPLASGWMLSRDPVALPRDAHYLQRDSIRSLILKTLSDFELHGTTATSLQAEDKDFKTQTIVAALTETRLPLPH